MSQIDLSQSRKKASTHRLQVTRGSVRYNVTLSRARSLTGAGIGISWEVAARSGKSRILGCGTSMTIDEAQTVVTRLIQTHERQYGTGMAAH